MFDEPVTDGLFPQALQPGFCYTTPTEQMVYYLLPSLESSRPPSHFVTEPHAPSL
jgi:hypothetical protein